jgi:zinc/manganese transport system substrate-binding protein
MKRTFLRMSLLALAALIAPEADAALKVFACEPEWAALTKELGGDEVDVFTATTALQDPHQIQARPSLIAALRRSDLLVCTGAELEIGWLPLLQRQSGNANVQSGRRGYFEAADAVELLGKPSAVDRSMGDVHPAGNPHFQTDPRRVLDVAKALAARMGDADPANRDLYAHRLADFSRRWQAATARWQERAAPLKGVRVVSHHDYWIYLYDWLGIRQVGTLEPKPGIPPSASHLAELKRELKEQPAKLIIRTAYDDPRASEWLSDQTGIPAVLLPGTVGGTDRARDLFSLFDDTIDRLTKALH